MWFLCILFWFSSLLNMGFGKNSDNETCTSVTCLGRAYDIKDAMNLSVDPCIDFYQFSCGNFIKKTRIPDDKSSVDVFTIIGDELLERGRDLLEEEDSEDEGANWKQLYELSRTIYRDCMDEVTLEKLGLSPAKGFLAQVGGLIGNNGKPWQMVATELRKIGFSSHEHVINVDVDIDEKQPERRSIILDQPSLGIEREYLVGEDSGSRDFVKAYEKYMITAANLFGGAAEAEMKQVLEFETELAKASTRREDRRDSNTLYNPYLLGEVSGGSWVHYVGDILGIAVNGSERVIVKNPTYMESLPAILDKAGNETINSYLAWRALKSVMQYLNKEARSIRQDFIRATEGKKEQSPRWMQCVKLAGIDNQNFDTVGLSLISGSMYVKRFMKPAAKKQLITMNQNLRRAFKKVLEEIDWMDAETKQQAFLKLEKMLENIGYPDEVLDENKMKELHQGIVMEKGQLLKNLVAMDKFWNEKQFDRLRANVSRDFWLDNEIYLQVAVANAFYNPSTNSMSFPAGFISGMMFNAEAPKYMNYGGIGSVIGHEISHGFDDEGRLTDETGALKNWWSNETLDMFKTKTQCVIDQYSNFEVKEVGLKLNGAATQGENIADIVGRKIARMAYEFWLEENSVDPQLPGLTDFNPRQMFWVSAARALCAKYTPAQLKKTIITDDHSPMQFRANGPAMNLDSFAKDFGCPVGSPMNPAKKCVVW